jgi:hypothetical protein
MGLLIKYYLDDQIKEERWVGMWHIRGRREKQRFLVGKPERKRPPGICRHRWENISKMDLKEIGWDGME